MKKLGIALMTIGVVILLYIGVEEYMAYKERQALIQTVLDVSKSNSITTIGKDEGKNKDEYNTTMAVGILEIPKIDLVVPIVEGATQKSLKNAVGHIEGTGKLGEMNQNYCIAGHRSHTTGRFFNRLDELDVGDEFKIKTAAGEYNYLVFKKEIVTPDKVEVLNAVNGKSMVTLITCHPLYSNKQRLIVYGELKK